MDPYVLAIKISDQIKKGFSSRSWAIFGYELADRWILIAKMVGKTAERKKVTRWTEEEHRFFTIIISFLFLFFCCLVSEKKTSEKAFSCM